MDTLTIEKTVRVARATTYKTGVSQKMTASKGTDDDFDITPEYRERLIAELRASLEKSLETERLEKAKNAALWEIPKEKMTEKDRKMAIADLNASIKRSIGRRSKENLLRILENDRDSRCQHHH